MLDAKIVKIENAVIEYRTLLDAAISSKNGLAIVILTNKINYCLVAISALKNSIK